MMEPLSAAQKEANAEAAASELAARFSNLVGEHQTPAHKPPAVRLSDPQKAAIIISMLGPEESGLILRQLTENEVRVFARASTMLPEVPRETLQETVTEFVKGMNSAGMSVSTDKLKSLLSGIMSDDAIDRIFEDLDESAGRSVWDKLSNIEVPELASFLSREHPQTSAVVLSRIKSEKAARCLARFDPAFADEVMARLAKVNQLKPGVMEHVKQAIEGEFLYSARRSKSRRKPEELIGSIMNFLPNGPRDRMMKSMEDRNPSLATAVQRKMFTFADIPKRLERVAIGAVMRIVDNQVMLKALAGAKEKEPETVEFILTSISKRLAEQMQEDLEAAATPSTKDAEQAQFEVVSAIRSLADKGEITINLGEEGDDEDA